jgi:hypothetical protein
MLHMLLHVLLPLLVAMHATSWQPSTGGPGRHLLLLLLLLLLLPLPSHHPQAHTVWPPTSYHRWRRWRHQAATATAAAATLQATRRVLLLLQLL